MTYFFIALSYLIGSISSAIVACSLVGAADPRTVGSNNPGATNVYRTAGKNAAALTFFGDLLKGVIPVWLASLYITDAFTLSLVAMAALLGHCYPIFFQFKGGKGVATIFGAMLAFHWQIGLSLLAVWSAVFMLTKISSLSGIIASLTIPLATFYVHPEAMLPMSIVAVIILLRHYGNILNLFSGDERNFKKKKPK